MVSPSVFGNNRPVVIHCVVSIYNLHTNRHLLRHALNVRKRISRHVELPHVNEKATLRDQNPVTYGH